jgi:nitrile hydratase subunit beta
MVVTYSYAAQHSSFEALLRAQRNSSAMERPHDIGGLPGYGTVDATPDREPFHHEWEARVFALNRALLGKGLYTLDEFRDTVEQMPDYHERSYYERWLHAIETLLERKGILDV